MADARQTRALLELVAHLGQSEEQARRSPRVLSPAEDLSPDLVRHHQLGALAFRAGYDAFRDEYARAAIRGPLAAELMTRAVAALTAEGVAVIVRGPASLVGIVYHEPGERAVDAVELLVRREDLALARRALGEPSGEVAIELRDTIPPPLRDRIAVEPVWARALPAIERDDDALRLDPVDDAVLLLATIAASELMVPAILYVDAARMLRRRGCDRRRVMARAAELGLARAITATLAMTAALADGAADIRWPDRRLRLLPSPAEVVAAAPVAPSRRALRRAALAESARELAARIVGRVSRRFGQV